MGDIELEEKRLPLTVQEQQMETYRKIQFHKSNINLVKNKLGKRCSYLSWSKSGEDYQIKAVLDGEKVYVALGGTPDDVTREGYEDLFKQLDAHGKDQ